MIKPIHKFMFACATCLLLLAADHKDGKDVVADPTADISDFFVFPRIDSAGKKRLTMIMSTHPDSAPDALFSNAINYRFRLRPVKGFLKKPFRAEVTNSEFYIDCRVTGLDMQEMSCRLLHIKKNGEPVVLAEAKVNTRDPGGGSNPDMLIFAGSRADQLFSDRARVRMPVWRDTEFDGSQWPGVNTFLNQNVLSIVVDIDVDKFLKIKRTKLAAAAETFLITDNPESLLRIDRMGRVEITVFFIDVVDQTTRYRDDWNKEDTFAVDPENYKKYKVELQKGLKRMDGFDEKIYDWPEPHPWLELLLDDFLIIDLARPTKPSSAEINYLGIEIAEYLGRPSQVVGGRLPNENVIQKTLTFFINGLDRPEPLRGVGVDEPASYTVDSFPFVPPPHGAKEKMGKYE